MAERDDNPSNMVVVGGRLCEAEAGLVVAMEERLGAEGGQREAVGRATHADVKTLRIPTQDVEKHFPPLKQPKGGYKEKKLLVSYSQKQRWWMKIKFYPYEEAYMIAGNWSEYGSTHKLQARDVIRVFKVVKNVPNDKHSFFDYARSGKLGLARLHHLESRKGWQWQWQWQWEEEAPPQRAER
ncbi:hypothetical protein Acr_00g0079030 [Actinidia rufa]|uniref:AP2/B3-like transcriptional factor family protein n=1 Tax=Actinidia rufa TaxID=165716 RepID=A0A7J0DW45_9ERIC|nr:hypothetical protein Acr_00g0079030 [Actinidia rufa]